MQLVDAPSKVSFREALGFWFKLGWISFGGPAGQIALRHQELVERRRWLSERRFLRLSRWPGMRLIRLGLIGCS